MTQPAKKIARVDVGTDEPSTSSQGLSDEKSDASHQFTCPICRQILNDPYLTECRHIFCSGCFMKWMASRSFCPICRRELVKEEDNGTGGKSFKVTMPDSTFISELNAVKQNELPSFGESLSIAIRSKPIDELEKARDIIQKRLTESKNLNARNKIALFENFLTEYLDDTTEQIARLQRKSRALQVDLKYTRTQKQLMDAHLQLPPKAPSLALNFGGQQVPTSEHEKSELSAVELSESPTPASTPSTSQDTLLLMNQIERMKHLYPEMTSLYDRRFEQHEKQESGDWAADDASVPDKMELVQLANAVDSATRYTGCRSLAVINYGGAPVQASQASNMAIVSSIEFDRNAEYFVLAGVTKKIKVYKYEQVVAEAAAARLPSKEHGSLVHQARMEMECANKISCVSWNSYSTSILASSDYEGIVQLWDPLVGKSLAKHIEHEKRCWTVQFSHVHPTTLASGSDDGHMKLWSTTTSRSIRTIDVGVNICCVHFAPNDGNYIVLGAADHNVHRYDLRKTDKPVNTFSAHSKAVSYVKYLDDRRIVSASTDSTLRLWDIDESVDAAVRTRSNRVFTGHVNEKNFVGLACNSDVIVCGSELNALHVYHTQVSKALLSYDFTTEKVKNDYNKLAKEGNEEAQKKTTNSQDFVSAVCCKQDSNIVIGANSKGIAEILELL